MKVAITGVTGFVGGALAAALTARGDRVTALVRPSSPCKAGRGLIPINAELVEWCEGDVTNPASLRGAFDGADCLIHAAGMLGRADVPEATYFCLHEQGTFHVLNEAKRAGVPRILYVSSPGVLGPIDGLPADETAPLAPSNPYERSKAAAEQVALTFARAGLPIVIVRPEFIYGPGDLHVLGLFKAVQKGTFFTINGGGSTCHPTYIKDAVGGMLLAMERGRFSHIYHITGPTPVTFRELGETIAAVLDVPQPKLDFPRPLVWLGAMVLETAGKIARCSPPLSRTGVAFFSENRRFSWQKAHDELGYTPHFDLKRGVVKTIAWYRKNGLL
ncbi:MAG: NAD-dependent epimerase/dehydratase family protein [Anaerolineae bacterium]